MSETKHTPGPWTARGSKVLDTRMSLLAETHQTTSRPSAEEAAANARLIAAAPELLEALQHYVEFESAAEESEDISPGSHRERYLKDARAAIAKATERAS